MKEKKQFYYLFYFFLYSVIGWCYEVILEVFIYKWGFSNRGVLFGPYCPVYGFGALAFLFTIYPFVKNRPWKERMYKIPFVFVGCMGVATIIELVTSYLCEAVMGSWPWQTYLNYQYNFQGRIALSPSLRFGLGGVIFLYILQPLFEIMAEKTGKKMKIVNIGIEIIFSMDIIYTVFLK